MEGDTGGQVTRPQPEAVPVPPTRTVPLVHPTPAAQATPPQPDEFESRLEAWCRAILPRLERLAARAMGAGPRRWEEPGDLAQLVLLEQHDEIRAAHRAGTGLQEVERRLHARIRWRVRDLISRHKRQRGWSQVPPGAQDPPAPSSQALNRKEVIAHLQHAIARLPAIEAQIVREVGLNHRAYSEVGAELGLTKGAVRKRFKRALSELGVRLGSRFGRRRA